MIFKELLLERDRRHTLIMAHGTAGSNLKSILKFGLLANPKKRVYSRHTQIDKPGFDSYNGVYLTSDYQFALNAAKLAGKGEKETPIIVVVQYVHNSGNIDEDDITTFIERTITDQFYGMKFLDCKVALKDNFQDTVNAITEIFLANKSFKIPRESTYLVKQYVTRVLSILLEIPCTDSTINLSKVVYYDMLNYLRYDTAYDEIMQKLLAVTKPKEPTSIRVNHDIGFSGKTKILNIFDVDGQILYRNNVLRKI